MHLSKKQWYLFGGGVVLILGFLWWRARQASSASASGGVADPNAPTDTLGTITGQESSDYATLAGMLQQQQAQEQGDITQIQKRAAAERKRLEAQIKKLMHSEHKLQKELRKDKKGERHHHHHGHHHRHHHNHHHPHHKGAGSAVASRGHHPKHPHHPASRA